MSRLRIVLRSLAGGFLAWLLLGLLPPRSMTIPTTTREAWYQILLDRCSAFYEGAAEPNVEYEAFLDHYPVSKYYVDPVHNHFFPGPKPRRVPRLMRQFDWHVRVRGVPEYPVWLDDRRDKDPRTVLSGVDSVIDVILAAGSWSTARTDRILVLMGMSGLAWAGLGESEEARAAIAGHLGRLFSAVYAVGNDAGLAFRTAPLGLVEHKIRAAGPGVPVAAITAARVDEVGKPFAALAAFSLFSEDGDTMQGPLSHSLPETVPNTSAAILGYANYYSKIPTVKGRRSHLAGQVPKALSRSLARRWLASPAARRAGVVSQSFPVHTWWSELSRFRFLLSPMGDEIQSPKNVEALLVLTVPVTQRGPYRVAGDLQELGFPIVVLDEWDEVTPGNMSRWWEALSPRLASFRANCLTADAYWRMIIGEIKSCH